MKMTDFENGARCYPGSQGTPTVYKSKKHPAWQGPELQTGLQLGDTPLVLLGGFSQQLQTMAEARPQVHLVAGWRPSPIEGGKNKGQLGRCKSVPGQRRGTCL